MEATTSSHDDAQIPLTRFQRLPFEVTFQILSLLPRDDLINAQIAHPTVWGEVGAGLLNDHVIFAPFKHSMAYFERITGHGLSARTITHLIYVDLQLTIRHVHRDTYSQAIGKDDTRTPREEQQGFRAYRTLYFKQQRIFGDGDDLRILETELPKLTRLKKVTVIGGSSRLPGIRWFFESGPLSEDLAGILLAPAVWSYRRNERSKYVKWDGRGFQNLVSALAGTAVRPIKLYIGNTEEKRRGYPFKMGMPVSSMSMLYVQSNAVFRGEMRAAFSSVTQLNLQLDLRSRGYNETHVVKAFDNFPTLPRLTHLALGFSESCLHADYSTLVLSKTWPVLQAVQFQSLEVRRDNLLAFIDRHRARLESLALLQVEFEAFSMSSWMEVATSARAFVRFQDAEMKVLERVTDAQGQSRSLPVAEAPLVAVLTT